MTRTAVDHFVEVTLGAFFQLAQVLAPITVCVKQDTRDRHSSADFYRGYQQIIAEQAVAFVASVAYQLKRAGTLANPVTLTRLLDFDSRS